MKKALIYFTIIVGVAAIIGGCKSSDDDAATTDTSTCTGTSSGSGPTIGSVTLEAVAYLSNCFGGTKKFIMLHTVVIHAQELLPLKLLRVLNQ
jgi:hypothetical protein